MTNGASIQSITAQASAAARTNGFLKDIRPPVEIPNGWAWLIWLVGLLVAAGIAYWLWHRWKTAKSKIVSAPPIPAHQQALRRLERALDQIHDPREFCILVSDTVRWYLEERFDFHAPERTTEEFLYELKTTDILTTDQKQSLGIFLERCDLVKFARYEPGEPELRDLHRAAVRLVEETQPPPPAAPGATQAVPIAAEAKP